MKILLLTNSLGGLYSFRKEVVESLINEGHRIIISSPAGIQAPFFEELGCTILTTEFSRKGMNPLKDFGLLMCYIRLLRRERPDVVLSYTIKPNLYGGMACRFCKVSQIANVTGLGTAVENPGWLQCLTMKLYKFGLHDSKTVFFQNKANMEFCQQHKMVTKQAKLIPGSGVNLQYNSQQDYPPKDAPLRFIFISRLLKEKGIEEYLTAAQAIKKKFPNTEFHILGNCEDDYEQQVNELEKSGVIIFHGRKADIRPFLRQSCCTIHPSFYAEGMSNVLLESCAAGRPIITTDRPGCGEIVEDGVNGYIVKQRDSSDLIEKIEKFISLPYEKRRDMGMAARKKVEREFDRNIVVKAYLNVIKDLSNV